MRKLLAAFVAVCSLALPSIASAHTGSVRCDTTGVVFTYNANFQHNTAVTEVVKGAVTGNAFAKGVTVLAHTASTDTIALSSLTWPITAENGVLLVSATWSDGNAKGSIGPQYVTCPKPPTTPPVTNPPAQPVCPAGTNSAGISNGVLVCVTSPPPVQTVTNTITVTVPAAPAKAPKCPKGTKLYRVFGSSVICTKRHVVTKTKIKLIRYHPVTTPKKPRVGGIAG